MPRRSIFHRLRTIYFWRSSSPTQPASLQGRTHRAGSWNGRVDQRRSRFPTVSNARFLLPDLNVYSCPTVSVYTCRSFSSRVSSTVTYARTRVTDSRLCRVFFSRSVVKRFLIPRHRTVRVVENQTKPCVDAIFSFFFLATKCALLARKRELA